MPDEFLEVETGFSEVAVELFAADTVEGTLQRIVDLAASSIDGCDLAGILVIDEDDHAHTVAATEAIVTRLDEAQIDSDEGPCLDAARSGATFYATDLLDDERWPTFAVVASEHGIRSVLAYSLSAHQLGALNLYARLPAAFGVTDRAQGTLFSTLARLALDSAQDRAAGEDLAENLGEALKTREVIGQAQGILMEREQITPEQAFDILRRASQRMNRKLRDVARDMVQRAPLQPGDDLA